MSTVRLNRTVRISMIGERMEQRVITEKAGGETVTMYVGYKTPPSDVVVMADEHVFLVRVGPQGLPVGSGLEVSWDGEKLHIWTPDFEPIQVTENKMDEKTVSLDVRRSG